MPKTQRAKKKTDHESRIKSSTRVVAAKATIFYSTTMKRLMIIRSIEKITLAIESERRRRLMGAINGFNSEIIGATEVIVIVTEIETETEIVTTVHPQIAMMIETVIIEIESVIEIEEENTKIEIEGIMRKNPSRITNEIVTVTVNVIRIDVRRNIMIEIETTRSIIITIGIKPNHLSIETFPLSKNCI